MIMVLSPRKQGAGKPTASGAKPTSTVAAPVPINSSN
jgi:hypothetical protein